ncbi:MAG: hypothetical protein K2W97_04375 [Chthoniobacterales bacterium]|nr:hypothetical protein [Chthoniobacterales bacterium]
MDRIPPRSLFADFNAEITTPSLGAQEHPPEALGVTSAGITVRQEMTSRGVLPGYTTPPRSPRPQPTVCTPVQEERRGRAEETTPIRGVKKNLDSIFAGGKKRSLTGDEEPDFHKKNRRDDDFPPPPPPTAISIGA